ncbi:hypothetical protein B0H10DRAFT_1962715 [Mycena sp. CBHHK59/15]|nr:hypothetical protein B0H10DRAFT_1962715 [Mycena sp. CBHHK59/15]
MSRNSQRQSRTAKRVREAEQRLDLQRHLKDQIAEEAEARRQSTARTKDLNAQLKVMKTLSKGKGSTALPIILSASSSGRVTTAKPGDPHFTAESFSVEVQRLGLHASGYSRRRPRATRAV